MRKGNGVVTGTGVRKIVKEELGRFEERFEKKMDGKVTQLREEAKDYRDDILSKIDDVMGQLQDARDEQVITASLHRRVINLEDKVEGLGRIHPQGKHASV